MVVPCFNTERFVARAIASVLDDDGDVEVIVVDDGSTDSSAHVVGKLAERDERVKLLVGPNRGMAPRNTGLGAIAPTSRFVLFLDADDVLVPGALGALRGRLEREPALGAVFGARRASTPRTISPNRLQSSCRRTSPHPIACER